MEVIAFILTIAVGIVAENNIDSNGIGGIVAVAVMGAFILWSIRHEKENK